ncbi:MAG: hypothetical protein JNK51_04140 [Blastocatellia bacterium]|nr:hypothetical protein [Chloracidobacterium sp.]MBL8184093.1 hypothetical protein [Blastocatellia bacterium]HRJ89736.1 hypothetical protein [Pyrinomonadaceae bacterium]HRK49665.1 hypothetical protein [Pyrinomonadaceae bacterium]
MITLLVAAVMNAPGQTLVDKTVATVSDGLRTELITLSDLRWQLALQPNVSLSPPASADLNRALNLLIDQRLFALEAERLPRNPPTEKEISDKIAEILTYFPTTAEFESRLRAVGFRSIRDDNFERIIAQRVSIDKYLDFRFRSFIIVTSEDEANYYRDFFVPDFRRRFPDLLMPTLDEKRREINKILTEDRIAAAIEAFLDDAKRRAEIVILSEV